MVTGITAFGNDAARTRPRSDDQVDSSLTPFEHIIAAPSVLSSLREPDSSADSIDRRESQALEDLEQRKIDVDKNVSNDSEKRYILSDINKILNLYERPGEIDNELADLDRRSQELTDELEGRSPPRDFTNSPPSSQEALSENNRQALIDEIAEIDQARTLLIEERQEVMAQLNDQDAMITRMEATISGADRVLDRDEVPPRVNGELTEGEIALAREVFGDEIDYSQVRINHESYFPIGAQSDNRPIAPNGNVYFDPAGHRYREDFSTSDDRSRALFIHELAHVWQHQQGVNVKGRGIVERQYDYEITPGKPFDSYGLEQQADIIKDYFLLEAGLITEGELITQDNTSPPTGTTTDSPTSSTTTQAPARRATIEDYRDLIPFLENQSQFPPAPGDSGFIGPI